MGRIAQVAWQHETDKRLKAIQAHIEGLEARLKDITARIDEAKRGPGRPKLVRPEDPARND
jgi:hypothetical protein